MNVFPFGSQISSYWIPLHGSLSLSSDGGYGLGYLCDLSQQFFCISCSFFLFGNDNKSPNCLLNAKYYLKWSHIGESISIKTAEYAMFVACASIKCSSPERRSPDQLQIWQLCGIFFTGLLQSISFFNFMSVSCLRTILTRKKSVGWLLSFLFLLVVEFFLNFFKIAVQFGGMSG